MQIQIDGNAVQQALQSLSDKWPGCSVDIWVQYEPAVRSTPERVVYCAFVRSEGASDCAVDENPTAAAAAVIERFKPEEAKAKRVKELRAELAKLEPAAEPAVRFEGKAPE